LQVYGGQITIPKKKYVGQIIHRNSLNKK